MQDKAHHIANVFSGAAYWISGSLVLGDYIEVIDQHTWIIGALLGFLTYITNVIFRVLHYVDSRQKS